MLLTVTIKNDIITFGLVSSEDSTVCFTSGIFTDLKRTSDEYAIEIKRIFDFYHYDFSVVEASILCSVVPDLTSVLMSSIRLLSPSPVYTVRAGIRTGFRIAIDNPCELGADIVANIAGGCERAEGSFILIDMGSTTTVSAVLKKKDGTFEFLGCSILPGISSMKKDLESSAALISEVTIPKNIDVIGNTTAGSVAAGIYYGNAFMIDGFIRSYSEKMKDTDAVVYATGKEFPAVRPFCSSKVKYLPDLTIQGLTFLYRKNFIK